MEKFKIKFKVGQTWTDNEWTHHIHKVDKEDIYYDIYENGVLRATYYRYNIKEFLKEGRNLQLHKSYIWKQFYTKYKQK